VAIRFHRVFGLALAMAMLTVAPVRALEPGDDQYPNSIIAPEPGTRDHHRALPSRRHAQPPEAPVTPLADQHGRRPLYAVRGSSGSVLPTPLPRTPLIPPENGGAAPAPALSQAQGPTVLPGLSPVPNLPHGAETFQDRASRCAFQQGLYNVPAGASTQYTGACLQ
jgi:hypothetical protein